VPIISAQCFLRDLRHHPGRLVLLAVGARAASSVRASRFSLELKSWSTRSSSIRMLRASMCVMKRSDIEGCLLQQPHHLGFVDQQDHARRERRGAADTNGLSGQTSFAEEVAGPEHRHDGLSPGLREDRQLDAGHSECT